MNLSVTGFPKSESSNSSITVLFGSQSLKSNGYLQKIEDYLNANNSADIFAFASKSWNKEMIQMANL